MMAHYNIMDNNNDVIQFLILAINMVMVFESAANVYSYQLCNSYLIVAMASDS